MLISDQRRGELRTIGFDNVEFVSEFDKDNLVLVEWLGLMPDLTLFNSEWEKRTERSKEKAC